MLDLSGVSAGDPAGARVVASDLVKSYRVISYASGQKPVVRLEILLSQGVEPRLERKDPQDLTLFASRTPGAAAPVAISAAPSLKPATAKSVDTKTPGTTFESINQVNLGQNGEQTEVNVLGSGQLTYHATRLQNPDRLVLDFSGSHLKTAQKQIASNLDPVREIRLAQFTPEVSRVVIDLRQPARYNINATGNSVTVAFAPKTAKGGDVKSTRSEQPSNLTTTKSESVPSATRRNGGDKARRYPGARCGSSGRYDSDDGRPRNSGGTFMLEAPAAPNDVSAAAPIRATASAGKRTRLLRSVASGKYSGEPISVNLKDVDLRDFFRLIHEISGLNVVVDPTVKGNLTIVLDDVPWDQALDIVLKNNDLDKQLDGNVLRVATKDTLKKEAEENRDLAKAQAEAADVVTTTRVLSYAKATEMVGDAQEIPLFPRRHSCRRPLEYADHSRHSQHSAGDGQPDSPARPQVAAGGNRSPRGGGKPHLLARNRHAVRVCCFGRQRQQQRRRRHGRRGHQPGHPNFPADCRLLR